MFDGEIMKKNSPFGKNFLGHPVHFFEKFSQTFQCLSSLSCLYRQQ